jgi:hypothetical protein
MSQIQKGDIERAVAALGQPFLEFICATPIEQWEVHEAAIVLIREINLALSTAGEGGKGDSAAIAERLKYRMAECTNGEVLALVLHRQAGGVVRLPATRNRLDELVVRLAAECYPLFLLPPDEFFKDIPGMPGPQVSSTMFNHDLAKQFERAVLADSKLSEVFKHHSKHAGYTAGMIYRNTGQGSGLQLSTLLGIVLGGAWRSRPNAPTLPGVTQFCSLALARWHLIRDALTKKSPQLTSARFAFAGVKLPGPGPYKFADVVVRQADVRDQEYVPKHLVGQLSGTDASGNSVMIDYAGDVVAEMQFPYVTRLIKHAPDEIPEWPPDLMRLNNVEAISQRLRISLLLAVHRDHHVQIVPSWQNIDDPLAYSASVGWGDTRQAVSLMPTQLIEQEVADWQEWYRLLGMQGSERLTIAVSRIIRAVAERGDAVDVLIDSVIAWENLFGSGQGESTLRVTASMALLLEDDPTERFKLREKLGRIYKLRSKAVHGSSLPRPADVPLCYEALNYAIQALKIMFKERPDLLEDKDGTGRSLKLILE